MRQSPCHQGSTCCTLSIAQRAREPSVGPQQPRDASRPPPGPSARFPAVVVRRPAPSRIAADIHDQRQIDRHRGRLDAVDRAAARRCRSARSPRREARSPRVRHRAPTRRRSRRRSGAERLPGAAARRRVLAAAPTTGAARTTALMPSAARERHCRISARSRATSSGQKRSSACTYRAPRIERRADSRRACSANESLRFGSDARRGTPAPPARASPTARAAPPRPRRDRPSSASSMSSCRSSVCAAEVAGEEDDVRIARERFGALEALERRPAATLTQLHRAEAHQSPRRRRRDPSRARGMPASRRRCQSRSRAIPWASRKRSPGKPLPHVVEMFDLVLRCCRSRRRRCRLPIFVSPTRNCGSSERCATASAASCHQRSIGAASASFPEQLAPPLDQQRRRLPVEDVQRLTHSPPVHIWRLLLDQLPLVPLAGARRFERERRGRQLPPRACGCACASIQAGPSRSSSLRIAP